MLKGVILANNSVVDLDDIGEDEDALLCKTDLVNCCGTHPDQFGEFYYPNGSQIPINNHKDGFYRNRGDQTVRLNRREGVKSPTGVFRCEIPDGRRVVQNMYITLA